MHLPMQIEITISGKAITCLTSKILALYMVIFIQFGLQTLERLQKFMNRDVMFHYC